MSPITVIRSAVLSAVLQLLGVEQDTLGVFLLRSSPYIFQFVELLRFFNLRLPYLRQDPPLEAILVIFGRRALIFFCLKALGKK